MTYCDQGNIERQTLNIGVKAFFICLFVCHSMECCVMLNRIISVVITKGLSLIIEFAAEFLQLGGGRGWA